MPAKPTLIITANYDAGRTGLVHHPGLRALTARLNRLTGSRAPGWLGWFSLALIWLLVVAVLRLEGSKGSTVGVLQLIPTVALVLALALLLELASSDYGPAAADNGSGTAAAIALAAALDTAPPRHAEVAARAAGRERRQRTRSASPSPRETPDSEGGEHNRDRGRAVRSGSDCAGCAAMVRWSRSAICRA